MNSPRIFILASVLLVLPCFAQANDPKRTPEMSARQRAEAGAATLQHRYVERTGLYETTGWWNSANAVTALIDLMRASGSRAYQPMIANTFTQAQVAVPAAEQTGRLTRMTGEPGFINQYYDDEGWWALAWIDAYDLTGEQRYLEMARSIFTDMAGGWDGTCGGGIWWSKDRTYKNAIANELFFSVAAHLAARGEAENRRGAAVWAEKEWCWFQTSGMMNGDHLVNDGLTVDKANGSCRNNGRTPWTYNQGVVLGALTEWWRVKQDAELLLQARVIADASLSHLTDFEGVLHDPCEPAACGPDAVQFKGIYIRNLRKLDAVVHEPRYRLAFEVNAESLWMRSRGADGMFGVAWTGPALPTDAGAQSSALDALVAAMPERN